MLQPAENFRPQRLSQAVSHALSVILQRHTRSRILPLCSISSVQLSRDLQFADVYIAPLQLHEEATCLNWLRTHSKRLRYTLAQETRLRRTPLLRFHMDPWLRHQQRTKVLLQSAKISESQH